MFSFKYEKVVDLFVKAQDEYSTKLISIKKLFFSMQNPSHSIENKQYV